MIDWVQEFSGVRLRDWRDDRDWRRPWLDPPGWWPCCCGGTSYAYHLFGGNTTAAARLQDTQRYEIDTWTSKTNMPVVRDAGNCQGIAGACYVMMGVSNAAFLTRCDQYVPDAWTAKASASAARYFAGSFQLADSAYIAGGQNSSAVSQSSLFAYDTVNDSWATKASMANINTELAGMASASYGYAVCGFRSAYLQSNLQYDAGGDSWATKTNVPTTRSDCGALWLGGKGYVFGGIRTGGVVTTNEQYDESGDSWTTSAAMITGREWTGYSDVTSNVGYATGGQNTSGLRTTTHEEFTPAAWTSRTGCTTIRQQACSGKA